MSSPNTYHELQSRLHGMELGDYLELMSLYLLAHRIGEDAEHSEWLLDRLHTLRRKYQSSTFTKVLNDFHKTRKAYDPTWKTTTSPSARTATQSESNHNADT